MTDEQVKRAAGRANAFLTMTSAFEELGLTQLSCAARMVATDAVDLADAVEAERSARRAMQEARERWEKIALARSREAACAA